MSAPRLLPDSQIEFRRRDTEIAVAAFRTIFLLIVMFSSRFLHAAAARGDVFTAVVILAALYNLILFLMHARGIAFPRWLIVAIDLVLVTIWIYFCGAGCSHYYALYYPVLIVAGLWFGVAGAFICALLAGAMYVWTLVVTIHPPEGIPADVVFVQIILLIATAGVVSITAEIQARERRALDASRSTLQRLATRIRIARNVDELVRPQKLPASPGLDVAFRFRPAAQAAAAGDYYDLISLGERRWGLCVADIRANLEASIAYLPVFKAALRVSVRREQSPARVLTEANRQVAAEIAGRGESDAFVSMCYVMIDLDAASLSYAVAGNEPPVLLRADRQPPLSLAAAGPLLGVLPDASYEEETLPLGTGDAVVLFTDGMTELRDHEGRFLDREGLIASILGHAPAPTAEAMAGRIFDDANEFGRTGRRDDDMTLMVARVTATNLGGRGGSVRERPPRGASGRGRGA